MDFIYDKMEQLVKKITIKKGKKTRKEQSYMIFMRAEWASCLERTNTSGF